MNESPCQWSRSKLESIEIALSSIWKVLLLTKFLSQKTSGRRLPPSLMLSVATDITAKVSLFKVFWGNDWTDYLCLYVSSRFYIQPASPLPAAHIHIFIGSLNHSTRLINVVAGNKLGSSDRRMSIPVSIAGDLWLVTAGPAPRLVLNHQQQLI